MAERDTTSALDQLRRQVAGILDDARLLDALIDGARSNSPEVAALPRAETERYVASMVRAAAEAFTAGRQLSDADLDVARRLGTDRAEQGVSIAALLDGFQGSRAELLRRLMAQLRAGGAAAELVLEIFVELDSLMAALEHRLTHAHRTAELERARTARDQRALLLRSLLLDDDKGATGSPAPTDPEWLGTDAGYHCLVTGEHDARAAHRLEAALTSATGGLFGLVNGYLVGVATRLPPSGTVTEALVVAGPPVPLGGLPEVYRLCLAARGAAADHRGLWHLDELAVDTALSAAPELGEVLADTLLATLSPQEPFHRVLVDTALAYLDHGRRVDTTAAALHVHPNTVTYRLRKLAGLTAGPSGRPGRDGPAGGAPDGAEPGDEVRHTVRWWWALHTWRRRQ